MSIIVCLLPGSACETYKMTNNASSTIAALRTVLETYGRKNEMLEVIPPIPLRYIEVQDSANSITMPVLKQTIAPAKSWERINNVETPQLYSVFPWRVYGIGKEKLEVARDTYFYDPDAIKFRSYIGWKQDNIWAACLGLTEESRRLNLAKLSNGPRSHLGRTRHDRTSGDAGADNRRTDTPVSGLASRMECTLQTSCTRQYNGRGYFERGESDRFKSVAGK